jgi:hypothetical protein
MYSSAIVSMGNMFQDLAMFKVSPTSPRHILTCQTVFSKTMFSKARSTFQMYSVMSIFKSSILWGLFKYVEFFFTVIIRGIETFWSPHKILFPYSTFTLKSCTNIPISFDTSLCPSVHHIYWRYNNSRSTNKIFINIQICTVFPKNLLPQSNFV